MFDGGPRTGFEQPGNIAAQIVRGESLIGMMWVKIYRQEREAFLICRAAALIIKHSVSRHHER